MRYLALGDSISIDEYTEVAGGGAACQFAEKIEVSAFQNLTRDGRITADVLKDLDEVSIAPDIITLTAGGNDFLQGCFDLVRMAGGAPADSWAKLANKPLENLRQIAERLAAFRCPVIINTVYDPTDGDNTLFAEFGVPAEARPAYNALNDGIRALARQHSFLLSDLEILFKGHGIKSSKPWFVMQIEPNFEGATAISRHWIEIYRTATQ